MLASLADAPLDDPAARLRTEIRRHPRDRRDRRRSGARPALVAARQREDAQFPEIAAALETVGARAARRRSCSTARSSRSTRKGEPPVPAAAGPHSPDGAPSDRPPPARLAVAFIAFDLLRDGDDRSSATGRSLERRARARAGVRPHAARRSLRISEHGARRRPRAVQAARSSSGWEGLIAKHADSLYKSGKRTPDWRKLKIVHEQEFVVGGWTEPRQTRAVLRRAAARRLRQAPTPSLGLRRPHRAPASTSTSSRA